MARFWPGENPVTVALRFTSADLESLPDLPGVRYEIIDGELLVSRQPQLGHQHASGQIYAALLTWSEQTGAGLPFMTPGLVFSEDNDVIPDLVWVSMSRLAESRDEKGHLRLAPELVVEVLSPGRANEVRDRELKLNLYSRQGVREYWIVDWPARTVEVFQLTHGQLEREATLSGSDILESPLLPGFSFPVSSLWSPHLA